MRKTVPAFQYRQLTFSPNPIAEIYWFPHAGGSTGALVRPAKAVKEPVVIRAAVLPGHEERTSEPPARLAAALIDAFSREIMLTDRPLILIGHSMGASLAFRVIERLIDMQQPPALLVVLAATPPNRLNPQTTLNRFDDDNLLDELERHGGGIPPALRENPEARNLFLPMIRADLTLLEKLAAPPHVPISVPILALNGRLDRLATEEKMQDWQRLTSNQFHLETFDGNHFFPTIALAEIVSRSLRELHD